MDPQISQVRRPANDPGKVQEQCEKKNVSAVRTNMQRKHGFANTQRMKRIPTSICITQLTLVDQTRVQTLLLLAEAIASVRQGCVSSRNPEEECFSTIF